MAKLQQRHKDNKAQLTEAIGSRDVWDKIHTASVIIMAVFPKNQPTVDLIRNTVIRGFDDSLRAEQGMTNQEIEAQMLGIGLIRLHRNDPEKMMVAAEAASDYIKSKSERSPWYTIGTSLCFEAVMLLLSCWIFVRRDF